MREGREREGGRGGKRDGGGGEGNLHGWGEGRREHRRCRNSCMNKMLA